MPLAQISLLEGASSEQKKAVIASVTEAIAESLGAPPASVRVLLTELPDTHWGVGGKSVSELSK